MTDPTAVHTLLPVDVKIASPGLSLCDFAPLPVNSAAY